ncbi:hypothetical protein [Nitrosospira sp. Nsp13]|uniref:hypothetical protein n=1 Tax=Nitrosospira sp. Nsp13 TaxID=1855332 RepID=UPI000885A209|nr:hypothetical protein [Nitrosospira sp. Nsp13]SCY42227.1 hypothetical protein SAMN05216308_11095 [Nitrosospira sp. Nsp13]
MTDLSTFERYYKLADDLIERSTKEQLAECTRLLALNLAHHQALYGEIPQDQMLTILEGAEPSEAQLKLLIDGMKNLIGVLANNINGLDEQKH